jgi:hypothetical protein
MATNKSHDYLLGYQITLSEHFDLKPKTGAFTFCNLIEMDNIFMLLCSSLLSHKY